LNVLFDDDFVELFQQTGATKSCKVLDSQNGSSKVTFWDRVAEAYNNPENIWFDKKLFDPLNKKVAGIIPKVFVNHRAMKLQFMWKKLNKKYNEARQKYQRSGNHDPNYASVIPEEESDDFKTILTMPPFFYLRKHVESRPGLNELVVCVLDDSIALESPNISDKELIGRREEKKEERRG
jgi:hypothetical protein